MQNQLNEHEKNLIMAQTRFLEHLALMTESMTRLISKYEMVIENYKSVLCTLTRIEDKIDNLNIEEVDQT